MFDIIYPLQHQQQQAMEQTKILERPLVQITNLTRQALKFDISYLHVLQQQA